MTPCPVFFARGYGRMSRSYERVDGLMTMYREVDVFLLSVFFFFSVFLFLVDASVKRVAICLFLFLLQWSWDVRDGSKLG